MKLTPGRVGTALAACFVLFSISAAAATNVNGAHPGAASLAEYFRKQTSGLAEHCLDVTPSLQDWQTHREELRQQLFEMLSLSPLPERTDLKAVTTGKLDADLFTVEKIHFQSMPGLYVTGNLYVPKKVEKLLPAILYLCGHAAVVTNGISYGNKTAYQHHGAWFARNGYVCLIIDTIQLGEIQGLHHGTYREGMWWWNSRGYSPAGVEAWNSIRALDYLQARPEVDPKQLGVTGRSGGGAYSWWVAALDERVKVAAPVAGMTDLHNHVVDGTVQGHCDCMFMVNTYRWDYPLVAALIAPRPLLICNSDKDSIFPLDGVVRVHEKVDKIYRLYGQTNNLGLLITEGPHQDTQDLQLPVFRWFNRHLKGEDPVIEMAATRFFTPQQLRVFDSLPADERTSKIHETFVPLASAPLPPQSASEWASQRDGWKAQLLERVFRGWPQSGLLTNVRCLGHDGALEQIDIYEFTSQNEVELRLYVLYDLRPARTLRLTVRNEQEWAEWVASTAKRFPDALHDEAAALGIEPSSEREMQAKLPGTVEVCFAPRGIGLNAWASRTEAQTQVRRRFMLLGQMLDGMRVWDIRRAMQALRSIDQFRDLPLAVEATGEMGVNTVYAALFEKGIRRLVLTAVPSSHQRGPDYLNVLRFLDVPQAVAMAAENVPVLLRQVTPADWVFPVEVRSSLGWAGNQFGIEPMKH